MMEIRANSPASGTVQFRFLSVLTWFFVGLALLPVTLLCAAWLESPSLLIPVALHFAAVAFVGFAWTRWVRKHITSTEKDSEQSDGEPTQESARSAAS